MSGEKKTNSVTITNTIHPDFNFAKHKEKEYNVFSGEITDPSKFDGDWLAINSEYLILTDGKTLQKLKQHKIHWNFDDNNVIISAEIFLN